MNAARLERMDREVGAPRGGRPSYRWAEGWIVVGPDGARYFPPTTKREAIQFCREKGWLLNMENETPKNAAAVALGRLGKGKRKTITPEERLARQERAARAREAIALRRLADDLPTDETPGNGQ